MPRDQRDGMQVDWTGLIVSLVAWEDGRLKRDERQQRLKERQAFLRLKQCLFFSPRIIPVREVSHALKPCLILDARCGSFAFKHLSTSLGSQRVLIWLASSCASFLCRTCSTASCNTVLSDADGIRPCKIVSSAPAVYSPAELRSALPLPACPLCLCLPTVFLPLSLSLVSAQRCGGGQIAVLPRTHMTTPRSWTSPSRARRTHGSRSRRPHRHRTPPSPEEEALF